MSSRNAVPRFTQYLLAALACCLPSCADGGTEDRPHGDVQIAATDHLFGLVGKTRFDGFPIEANEVLPLGAKFILSDDSSYAISDDDQAGATILADDYALDNRGTLALLQRRSGRSTLVFRGAWDLNGNSQNMFFTDRIGTNVGMYIGVKYVGGEPDLEALATASPSWHAFSMTTIFAGQNASNTKENVGRAFAGALELSFAAGKLSVTGTGHDSRLPSANQNVDGELRGFADRTSPFQLDLTYGDYTRSYSGGGTDELIFGIDRDKAQGAAGLLAMVRERKTEPRVADMAGTYTVGLWTIFLDPNASGLDAAIGTLELTTTGGFQLTATDHAGEQFTYTGDYRILVPASSPRAGGEPLQGSLEFELSGTGEVWFGAVDEDSNTILVLDPVAEQRSNAQSEHNFIMAVRETPDSDD